MREPQIPDRTFAEQLWDLVELEAFGPAGRAGTVHLPRRRATLLAAAAAVIALLMLITTTLQGERRASHELDVTDPGPTPTPRTSATAMPVPTKRPSPLDGLGPVAVAAPPRHRSKSTAGAARRAVGRDANRARTVAAPRPPAVALGELVFGAPGDTGTDDLFSMDVSTGRVRSFGETPHNEIPGSFSPDGRSIVIWSGGRREHSHSQLYVVDSARGGERRLTETSCSGGTSAGACSDRFPTWSPRGDWIAFARGVQKAGCRALNGGCSALMLIRPDGTGLRQLTAGGEADWSPDGRRLVFVAPADEVDETTCDANQLGICDGALHVINADGTGRRSLGLRGQLPRWSPDGTRIVYYTTPPTSQTQYDWQVHVANADGTNARPVLPVGHTQPVWTPDGRGLVSIKYDGNQTDLWLSGVDGADPRRLTDTPGSEFLPFFRRAFRGS